jgi:isopentenyl-diphosphate delta-isomerase
VTDAARDRLAEEIGVRGVELTEIGVHLYRADDPATGRVEHEYDHVLLGRVDAGTPLTPDPAEVADLRWTPARDVPPAMSADPAAYAPWLAGVVATLGARRVIR